MQSGGIGTKVVVLIHERENESWRSLNNVVYNRFSLACLRGSCDCDITTVSLPSVALAIVPPLVASLLHCLVHLGVLCHSTNSCIGEITKLSLPSVALAMVPPLFGSLLHGRVHLSVLSHSPNPSNVDRQVQCNMAICACLLG